MSPPLDQPRRIARHQVDFEIDRITGAQRSESRYLKRMGNDQHVKTVVLRLVDGERSPVKRDRALGGDEARQLRRRPEGEPGHLGEIFPRHKLREAVDVAGHDVAAKFVADLEGAFEIEPGAVLPATGCGDGQGRGGGIHRKPGVTVRDARSYDGQADAVAGDRGAVRDGGAVVMAGDRELAQVVRPGRNSDHLADVGDDASEHFHALSKVSIVSSPTVSTPSERSFGESVNAVSGMASSASIPSGPIGFGLRNSTASSTRSAATKAAATVGPPSTISRVMPRSARTRRAASG